MISLFFRTLGIGNLLRKCVEGKSRVDVICIFLKIASGVLSYCLFLKRDLSGFKRFGLGFVRFVNAINILLVNNLTIHPSYKQFRTSTGHSSDSIGRTPDFITSYFLYNCSCNKGPAILPDEKFNTGPGAQQSKDADHIFLSLLKEMWFGIPSLLRIFVVGRVPFTLLRAAHGPRHPCLPEEGGKEWMGHRRYFVRKDPLDTGKTKEWIEMDGENFYRFLASDEAKGRRFVRIADNGDDECDVIYMEASDKDFRNWKANDNRRLYYKRLHGRRRKKVSLSEFINENENEALTFEDVIGSDDELPEDTAVRHMLTGELYAAMERLSAEERELLEMYYWESMKLQEIGRELGTTPQNIYQRLKRINRKLRRSMQKKKS